MKNPSDESAPGGGDRPAWFRRLVDRLFEPVDAASIAVFRVVFAVLMLIDGWKYYTGFIEWLTGVEHLFKYPGFGWVELWPGDGIFIHYWVTAACAVLVGVGLLYRLAAPLFALCMTYLFLLTQTQYLNHFYLICLLAFLLAIIPAHRVWSLDSLLWGDADDRTVPAWCLWMLRFQLAVPYFYGGLAKINADWLRGEPLGIWLQDDTGFPLVGRFFTQEWMIYLASWGSMTLDLLVVPFLLWRRTRPYAFAAAVLFHLSNAWIFEIGIFPWLMIPATTIFFRPDWPRRVLHWIGLGAAPDPVGSAAESRGQTSAPTFPLPTRRQLLLGGLGLYVAWQLLFPLRHLAYPGLCRWNEEGHLFSWHMMQRTKEAYFTTTIDADELRTPIVGPEESFLSDLHRKEILYRPNLLHRYAQLRAERMRQNGYTDVEVYIDAKASLNGRRFQHLIKPDVDLASVPHRQFWPCPIVEPLYEEFLPRGHPDRIEGPGIEGIDD